MPFSLFAARCIYVANQPLQYRQRVIHRLYGARVAGHLALFSTTKLPELLSNNLIF